MTRSPSTRTELARLGFADLSGIGVDIEALAVVLDREPSAVAEQFGRTADPDGGIRRAREIARRDPAAVHLLGADEDAFRRFTLVMGASAGLAEFFVRNSEELAVFANADGGLPTQERMRETLLASVQARDGFSALVEEEGWNALRRAYRRLLTEIAVADLDAAEPLDLLEAVSDALAGLASAALDAALAVARTTLVSGSGPRLPRDDVASTALAVIGMGKAGAGELNYVSDVDVIFVAEAADGASIEDARAVDVGTRLAVQLMRAISAAALEPGLWEVDPNLRPEGKAGALVRTLTSHITYYERWAQSWEFQALLKARALAGDLGLGERYVTALAPQVWSSASRENFVESVQRMRERVTENIPASEQEHQLKLGPGGLRDVEFTVQLLQLVHGQHDPSVRARATLEALRALAEAGYIGRTESAQFQADYRLLRLLEHRLQLSRLRRTHLMPQDESSLRILARSTGLFTTASELVQRWQDVKQRVRGLHERLFYRPLLSAVAALPAEGYALTNMQAEARLAAIGFLDPAGALAHIAALGAGVSRRASIQRTLLPVLLQWFAEGADPDYGLLAFRRLSDSLGGSPWYLRMLRDSSGAAHRLTRVLSGSRYVGELLDLTPSAAAWLENDEDLRPRSRTALQEEAHALVDRHPDPAAAAPLIRALRRREILRVALGGILGVNDITAVAHGLSDVADSVVSAAFRSVRGALNAEKGRLEFAVIALGRYGGRELGFGSDADVVYVFRAPNLDPESASATAKRIVTGLATFTEDHRVPFDLDAGLRPEGRNGPLVRSLESYRAYYARWSLTWEAQALLRARFAAGDAELGEDFLTMADAVRYPEAISERDVREVKRIKARVENERLPQGADPTRHLKLGRGSLSDVEWFVQLLQLQHAHRRPELRTTSTLEALAECERLGLVKADEAERLRAAWLLASRVRSAMTLWTNKTGDVLPVDRPQLEGAARLLGYEPGCATLLEEHYLQVTRRARGVFERYFYGAPESPYR